MWCLFGALAGAAGVVYVQEQYLPPRLSSSETVSLRSAYTQADADRKRLQGADEERTRLGNELVASQARVDRLERDLAAVVEALPPDPRGGAVEIRAARFDLEQGHLVYELVLSRAKPGNKPLSMVLQLLVTQDPAQGGTTPLPPETVSLDRHLILRGKLALPAGLRPRQATVQLLDRPQGQLLGTRILWVP